MIVGADPCDRPPEIASVKVGVSYERTGTEVSEPIYFGLDTEKLKPGWNQLEVRVTDLNGERTVSRKAMFRLDKE